MTIASSLSSPSSTMALAARSSMSLPDVARLAPAAFADAPAETTGPRYVFISTRYILSALMDAGFAPTGAVQTRSRGGQDAHARHMLRFQPVVDLLSLDDVLGEIVLINSHDGRSAYQLRAGLYRPVCTNGLLTAIGDFGLVHVGHRGNVVANVFEAAQRITRDFSRVGEAIQEMRATEMSEGQQLDFAREALTLRYPQVALATLVHRLAETVFGHYGRGNDIVKVYLSETSDYALAQQATDYEYSPAGALLDRAATEWGERLPGNPEALYAWLLAQDPATLLDLLAYCTARSLNAVVGRARGRDQSDAIAEALGVDVADWWVPTSANYLGSVSKAKALEAVKEATGEDFTASVTGLKKDQVALYCAGKLEGSRWLPQPLRPLAATVAPTDDE